MTPRHIGVIGCGPAGLVTALALERYLDRMGQPQAARITILDRQSSAADYPGVEYGIQERASRALDRLGLKDRTLMHGHPTGCFTFVDDRSGRVQTSVEVDPEWSIGVLRRQFLKDLEDALERTEVRRNHRVQDLRRGSSGGVLVDFAAKGPTEPYTAEFDAVIAADGSHSIARQTLFAGQAQTHDRGFSTLYLLVQAPDGASEEELPHGFSSIANGQVVEFFMGRRTSSVYFPAGLGRVTLAIGFGHDVKAQVWTNQGVEPEKPWGDLSADTKKAIALELAADTTARDNFFSRALGLIEDWDSRDIYLWAMRDSDPLAPPFRPVLPVILIGDAAHAFLPTLGMGASLAIEDAERLGARLAPFLLRQADQPFSAALRKEVFEPYAAERVPVWTDLMGRARAAAANWQGHRPGKRFLVSPFVPNKALSRLIGAYESVRSKVGV